MKISHDIMIYRKKIAKLYDTFAMFESDDGAGATGIPGKVIEFAQTEKITI